MKLHLSFLSVYILILLTVILPILPATAHSNVDTSQRKPQQFTQLFINGDSDLLQQADDHNWIGTGTVDDPILITGMSFNYRQNMFVISHTSLHVVFANNTLEGVDCESCAIVIWDCNNVSIVDNEIFSSSVGVHIWASNHTLVYRNRIYDCRFNGVYLDSRCCFNNITYNYMTDCREAGVSAECGSSNNTIHLNGILDCYSGVYLTDRSHSNVVTKNFFEDIIGRVFWVETNENQICSNYVSSGSSRALYITGNRTHISGNLLSNGTLDAVWILPESFGTVISGNMFLNWSGYAIRLEGHQTLVKDNDFIDNSDACQAKDDGSSNTISDNYWSEWNSPDVDSNGIVDTMYSLDGVAENADLTPRTRRRTEIQIADFTWVWENSESVPQNLEILPVIVTIVAIVFVASLVIWKRRFQS